MFVKKASSCIIGDLSLAIKELFNVKNEIKIKRNNTNNPFYGFKYYAKGAFCSCRYEFIWVHIPKIIKFGKNDI